MGETAWRPGFPRQWHRQHIHLLISWLDIEEVNGKIAITPISVAKGYNLDELLKQYNPGTKKDLALKLPSSRQYLQTPGASQLIRQ